LDREALGCDVQSRVLQARRLCVLNQISRGAQPPSAVDAWANTAPAIYHRPHFQSSSFFNVEAATNKIRIYFTIMSHFYPTEILRPREARGKKEHFLKSGEEA